MLKPSDPLVSPHAVHRFRERFARLSPDEATRALERLVKTGERWGPSSKGTWHLLVYVEGEPAVLAMIPDAVSGRPSVVTVLTLAQAIANQKRAFR